MYLSAFFVSTGVPNGEFPEILIAKCRSRFYCTFHGRKILKVEGRDGRDPQNREKNAPAGRFTCMSIWSWLFISVPMPLIDIHVRLLRRIGKTSVTANRWERYIIKVYYKLRRVPINTCSSSPVNMWKTLNKLQQKNKVTYRIIFIYICFKKYKKSPSK